MLLAALASAGIIGSAPAALFGRAPRELPPGRSFHEIRGEVTVDGDGANLRTEVRPGSVVATGAGAYAAFAVGDSAHILRANSRIELPGGGAARQALRVVTGALLSVFGKRKRRLETQVATIGIRGTGIYIEAEPDRSYICTCYGTADLGLVAYESDAAEGMILDESVIVEIVRPGTGDPVPEGEVGEVVVTVLNADYPLIRFGTGDLSAILPGISPCGRTAPRITGWMGRADQTTKVRGMFVHPEQVARVAGRHPEINRARLVVGNEKGQDTMILQCEVAGDAGDAFVAAIADSLQTECKLRGDVELVAPDSLPNDGKVIDDTRDYG